MSDIPEAELIAIHVAELPEAGRINDALDAAFAREQAGPAARRTHHFHDRFENIYIPASRLPELAPVTQFVHRSAAEVLATTALRSGFWFNAMPPGHRTTLHSHEENDERLSAVYYVRCPPGSGRLILHEGPTEITITPRPGLLVMFPPNLPHEVEENASAATRLSVAFNFGPAHSAS